MAKGCQMGSTEATPRLSGRHWSICLNCLGKRLDALRTRRRLLDRKTPVWAWLFVSPEAGDDPLKYLTRNLCKKIISKVRRDVRMGRPWQNPMVYLERIAQVPIGVDPYRLCKDCRLTLEHLVCSPHDTEFLLEDAGD